MEQIYVRPQRKEPEKRVEFPQINNPRYRENVQLVQGRILRPLREYSSPEQEHEW